MKAIENIIEGIGRDALFVVDMLQGKQGWWIDISPYTIVFLKTSILENACLR